MDYSIRITGEAGQGIQTIGDTLAKLLARAGYYVFTQQDYESRIRGGHNSYRIRFSAGTITASQAKIRILVPLDREGIALHGKELAEEGILLYDSVSLKEKLTGSRSLDIPFADLAISHGGNKIMANTVAVGAVLGVLGMGLEGLNRIITDTFQKKGEEIISANIRAALAGHQYAKENCPHCASVPGMAEDGKGKMLISGSEAIGLGAIASGCRFYAAYPMTPSTGIMNYIASKAHEYGIVVEQAEDEIAAINMALGASFAGVRAMTGTSGGGFSLMVEGLSLAAMTETPVVIALGQRPGPATGFPTRTEQGELGFALHAGHGEFPRVIFAPGTPEQAFHLTRKAFDLAEKYQIPAIILTDQHLADTTWSYDSLDLTGIEINDYRLRGEQFQALPEYKRHAFTGSGISPFGVPGEARHLVVTDSDEHDEEGHIVEDAETRIRMVQKRLFRKLPPLRKEIAPPTLYGHKKPVVLLAGWGSTFGVIREVVDYYAPVMDIAMLHFSEIYPFPATGQFNYLKLLREAELAVCVENNATGQFARLMRTETGYSFTNMINKYDGRPFSVEGLVEEIRAILG
ncbi:MAG: 2-oxoacid:acceptor oxidoreductase subunit alpha [Thermodesulfovibrionales bacterium]|jgi:2-oxoglutarate ferredoxin oxidoreductase subunit alpha